MSDMPKIKVMKNGPYLVTGNVPLTEQIIVSDNEGTSTGWKQGKKFETAEQYMLCRCGRSKNKPFCDGTHAKLGFQGKETADHVPFAKKAEFTDGPELVLMDNMELCVLARHCHVGTRTWNLVETSDRPEDKELAISSACNCPAGRLVVYDKETQEVIEPDFEPSIGMVEDPYTGLSGPIWVRGGIPVEGADGIEYEARNRVTLCRCGRSRNMPFCDGMHTLPGPSEKGK